MLIMLNESYVSVGFWDVFRRGQNDSLITKVPLRIGTASFEANTAIDKGAQLGGIDFHQHIGRNLAVVITNSGTYIIKGVYLPD